MYGISMEKGAVSFYMYWINGRMYWIKGRVFENAWNKEAGI